MNKVSYILLLVCCVFLLFGIQQCGKNSKLDVENAELNMTNKELKAKYAQLEDVKKESFEKLDSLQQANDSLSKIRPKTIIKLRKVTADAISVIDNSDCDSISKEKIKEMYDVMTKACDAVLVADSMVINNQKNQIKELENVVSVDYLMIQNKEQQNGILADENKILKKKLRRQKFKTAMVAIGGAAATALMTYLAIIK